MEKDILAMIAEAQQKTAKLNQEVASVIAGTERACEKIRKIEVDTTGIRRAAAQGRVACQEMDRISRSVCGKVAQA